MSYNLEKQLHESRKVTQKQQRTLTEADTEPDMAKRPGSLATQETGGSRMRSLRPG